MAGDKIREMIVIGRMSSNIKRFITDVSLKESSFPSNMKKVLQSSKIPFKEGHAALTFACPFCRGKPLESVFVNKTTGGFVCPPCNINTSWSEFCSRLKKSKLEPPTVLTDIQTEENLDTCQDVLHRCVSWKEVGQEVREKVVKLFGLQKLEKEIFDKYEVKVVTSQFPAVTGGHVDSRCVAFLWYGHSHSRGDVVRIKMETISPSESRQTKFHPKNGPCALFGWQTVPRNAKKIVVTADEFDAMAVHQSTGLPAVSLPRGVSMLPPELLPLLEPFEEIVLWLGGGVQARQMSHHFATKLSLERCFLVRSYDDIATFDSALDALNKDLDIKSILNNAQSFQHKKILPFRKLREEVLSELVNVDQVAGVKWRRFPILTTIVKGHRPGELTIFTGPTGSGKTTLMSELSLDLCTQGIPTLWGSFEIKNVRLAKIMLRQLSNLNLEQNLNQFNYWADKMELLPMYFMGFYGSVDVKTVIDAMSHASYVYDIRHVVIDNLQFMTGSTVNNYDRFSVQDHAVAEFRKFASSKDVHVTVVVHPRKEEDFSQLQTASIFGTAKASQESDNIVILQRPTSGTKYLEVTKNRFDGELGRVPLSFNKESLTFSGYKNPLVDKAEPQHRQSVPRHPHQLGTTEDHSSHTQPSPARRRTSSSVTGVRLSSSASTTIPSASTTLPNAHKQGYAVVSPDKRRISNIAMTSLCKVVSKQTDTNLLFPDGAGILSDSDQELDAMITSIEDLDRLG